MNNAFQQIEISKLLWSCRWTGPRLLDEMAKSDCSLDKHFYKIRYDKVKINLWIKRNNKLYTVTPGLNSYHARFSRKC